MATSKMRRFLSFFVAVAHWVAYTYPRFWNLPYYIENKQKCDPRRNNDFKKIMMIFFKINEKSWKNIIFRHFSSGTSHIFAFFTVFSYFLSSYQGRKWRRKLLKKVMFFVFPLAIWPVFHVVIHGKTSFFLILRNLNLYPPLQGGGIAARWQ